MLTKIFGQTFIPPVLPKTGKTISDFVPKGYAIIDSTSGDLNNDGLPDIAFVIQSKDTFDELRPDSTKLHSNPRILIVLLKQSTTYQLALQHNTFMLRFGEGGWKPDPFGKIEIENGLLEISYQFFKIHSDYKFQFQQNAFYLILASEGGSSANQYEGWEFDFITRKASYSSVQIEMEEDSSSAKTGNSSSPVIDSTEIKTGSLKKLIDMQMPGMWEVIPGLFI